MAKTDLGQKLIDRGWELGRTEEKRQTLQRLLKAKFGAIPEDLAARVQVLEDRERLDALIERVLTATSIEEMGL